MVTLRFGPQLCTTLEESAQREWLVSDGCGGYAMGTISGLRTRRYHGLQIISTSVPGQRHLGLVALDAIVEFGSAQIPLGVHEWKSGALEPKGFEHLQSFELRDGLPRWSWSVDGIVLERELAMIQGRPVLGIVHRLLSAPGPIRVTLSALCTWRDAHQERSASGVPKQQSVADGFTFEDAYRVRGPGWAPVGNWDFGVHYREESARGLPDTEDIWCAGTFTKLLVPGDVLEVEAWADDLNRIPPPAVRIVQDARARARSLVARSKASDDIEAQLVLASDQFVIRGPAVVAGYPWFGEWSRDSLVSYEGLFLATSRWDEGRKLLQRELDHLSDGMLPNCNDSGTTEFNSADGTLWLFQAILRHVEITKDRDLAAQAVPQLSDVIKSHIAGLRHNIVMDPADGLLSQGEDGLALTWMDARIDGKAVTARNGKTVEINALWANALEALAQLQSLVHIENSSSTLFAARVRDSFMRTFCRPSGVIDLLRPDGNSDTSIRPNQLLAVSLPYGPLRNQPQAIEVVTTASSQLLTPLGLRSLSPSEKHYVPYHRGNPTERDLAYHQGTAWPWLIGPYVDACLATNSPTAGILDGLVSHLADCGVGSVSETADGAAPNRATGCPFQAWSVAELLRARQALVVGDT